MANREKILQSLQQYTEKEKIYKRYYELRNDPEARSRYMKEIEDYVRENHLLIFEFPFIEKYPEMLTEADLYPNLSITKGSNVNVVRHLRYTPVFWHSHSFFTVLYVVLTGQCGHKVGSLDLPMKQGDLFFLPPYVKQTIEVFDDSIILNIHIRKDTFSDYFFNILRDNNVLSHFFLGSLYGKNPVQGLLFSTGDDQDIRDTFLDIYQEVQLDDAYSWRLLDNLVPLLFARLLRGYSNQVQFIGKKKRKRSDGRWLQLLSYMDNRYQTVTLDDLAEHFHYSVPYCSKLIRDETGMGFVAFVRKIRMDHATALLRNTLTPVADIGEMVGYENPESFIRAFKKVYEMSPSAYRRQNQNRTAT